MPAADASNPIEAVRARLDGGRRWFQGAASDPALRDRVCVVTACAEVGDHRAVALIDAVAMEQYPDRVRGVSWLRPAAALNDDPLTTWPEMDAFLDKASIAWDEQVR